MKKFAIKVVDHYSLGNPHFRTSDADDLRGVRSTQQRGKRPMAYNPKLTNQQNKRCCLGFYGQQIVGLKTKDMLNEEVPENVMVWSKEDPMIEYSEAAIGSVDTFRNSELCSEAIEINDAWGKYAGMSYDDRMMRLTKLFHDIGVKMEIVYPESPVKEGGDE